MKYADAVINGKLKGRLERVIKIIFQNITPSSVKQIIEENSPGVVIIDSENLHQYLKLVKSLKNKEERNFSSVLITSIKEQLPNYIDLVTTKIDEEVFVVLQQKLQEKMKSLIMQKFREIPERLMKIYEDRGCGLLIKNFG